MTSGDTTAWPLVAGTTPCRFRVFPPSPAASVTVPCSGTSGTVQSDAAPAVRLDAPYTFTGIGLYTI